MGWDGYKRYLHDGSTPDSLSCYYDTAAAMQTFRSMYWIHNEIRMKKKLPMSVMFLYCSFDMVYSPPAWRAASRLTLSSPASNSPH